MKTIPRHHHLEVFYPIMSQDLLFYPNPNRLQTLQNKQNSYGNINTKKKRVGSVPPTKSLYSTFSRVFLLSANLHTHFVLSALLIR